MRNTITYAGAFRKCGKDILAAKCAETDVPVTLSGSASIGVITATHLDEYTVANWSKTPWLTILPTGFTVRMEDAIEEKQGYLIFNLDGRQSQIARAVDRPEGDNLQMIVQVPENCSTVIVHSDGVDALILSTGAWALTVGAATQTESNNGEGDLVAC